MMPAYQKSPTQAASELLQAQLEERRAERGQRRRGGPHQVQFSSRLPSSGRDDYIFEADEPIRKPSSRSTLTNSSNASAPTRGMGTATSKPTTQYLSGAPGVKETSKQIETLKKENYGLKLRIKFQSEYEAELQAKVKEMEEKVKQYDELVEAHNLTLKQCAAQAEQLLVRGKAIEQATTQLCIYEARFEGIDDDGNSVTVRADSGYAGPVAQYEATSSPSSRKGGLPIISPAGATTSSSRNLKQLLQDITPAKPDRVPGFLKKPNPDTCYLRDVYLQPAKEVHEAKSFVTLLSKRTSAADDYESINPELVQKQLEAIDALSVSSFGTHLNAAPNQYPWEKVEAMPVAQVPVNTDRITQWVETNVPTTDSPPSPLGASEPDFFIEVADLETRQNNRTPTSFGGPIFDEPLLPQRPSTTLNDAQQRLASAAQSTVIGEKSVHDAALFMESAARTAPRQMRSSIELSSAHASNLEHRKTALSTARDIESAIDSDDSDSDSRSNRIPDFSSGWIGYPDGGSILTGTPSRFLNRDKAPSKDIFFDGNALASPQETRRRQSSSATAVMPAVAQRPLLERAGTSPAIAGPSKVTHSAAPRSKTPSAYNEDFRPASFKKLSSHKPDLNPQFSPHLHLKNLTDPTGRSKTPMTGESFSPLSQRAINSILKKSHARMTSRAMHMSTPTTTAESMSSIMMTPFSDPSVHNARDHCEPSISLERSPELVRAHNVSNNTPQRVAASPARSSLAQKTQQLLRRLSGSRGSDRDAELASPASARPILPTLTSTPSSAYVNVLPKEIRRASSVDRTPRAPRLSNPKPVNVASPKTSKEICQGLKPERQQEKKGIFTRGGSIKESTEMQRAKSTGGTGNGGKSPAKKDRRRSSVRHAD